MRSHGCDVTHLTLKLHGGFSELHLCGLGQRGVQVGAQLFLTFFFVPQLKRRAEEDPSILVRHQQEPVLEDSQLDDSPCDPAALQVIRRETT